MITILCAKVLIFQGAYPIFNMGSLSYYINSLVRKEKANILPLIISNIIFVVLLALTVIAWNFGFVENRNDRINFPQNISTNEPTNDGKNQKEENDESIVIRQQE